jgi:hypothetical protein
MFILTLLDTFHPGLAYYATLCHSPMLNIILIYLRKDLYIQRGIQTIDLLVAVIVLGVAQKRSLKGLGDIGSALANVSSSLTRSQYKVRFNIMLFMRNKQRFIISRFTEVTSFEGNVNL